MEKRGMSTVVATVLVLLILITAVGIFWVALNAFILSSTSEIRGLDLVEITIQEDSLIYNPDDSLSLRVERNSQPGNVSGVRVIFEDTDGKVESFDVPVEIDELEIKTLNVPLQGLIGNVSKVSIAPQTRVDGDFKTGNVADEYVIDKSIVSSQGLVGYWRLDGNFEDASGNNLDGDCTLCPVNSAGKLGSGMEFDSTGNYIEISNDNKLEPTNSLTISTWINVPSFGDYWVIDKDTLNTDYTNGYLLRTADPQEIVHFVVGGTWANSDVLQTDTWYHIAGTYDGSSVDLYVDGVKVATSPKSSNIPYTNRDLFLGSQDENGFLSLIGSIDEVRIYDRALTEQEVWYLYTYN